MTTWKTTRLKDGRIVLCGKVDPHTGLAQCRIVTKAELEQERSAEQNKSKANKSKAKR